MSCQQTAELLPWLLNGTLDKEQERQIQAHLETCEGCREELRQTRLAWSLAGGHLPAEALVDYALERPSASARRQLVESHLEHCARCREELELVRESPEPEVAETPAHRAPPSRRSEPGPWYVALAAALAALIAGGGWLWSSRQIARERDAWRRQAGELQARVEALSGPRLNSPIFDLLPSTSDAVLRSAEPAPDALITEVKVPAEVERITLTLLAGGPDAAVDHTVEILSDKGELIWRADGLMPSSVGHFTLSLPTDFLPPGRSTIQIARTGDRDRVVRYEIRMRSRAP